MTVTLDRNVEEFIGAPRQLFINGQWVDAASGKTSRRPTRRPARRSPTSPRATPRTSTGPSAPRARRSNGPWSRMTPSERGRIIWRIGDLILEHVDELAQLESLDNGKPFAVAQGRRRAAGRRPVPLHGRLGHQDRGQHDQHLGAVHAGRELPLLHAARADRRRRADHPVELPAADGGVEARPGAGHRLHRRAQARRADAADRAAAGRAHRRGRRARRRRQRGARLRRDRRRGAGRPPRRRQGRVHRLDRGRQADRRGRRGHQPEEAHARARRQEPEHRLRRRRGRRHRGRRQRDLLQPRPVLRGRLAAVRAAEPVRRGRRRRGRDRQVDQARLRAWTRAPRWARWSRTSSSSGSPASWSPARPTARPRSPAAAGTATAATSSSRPC